MFWVLRLSMEKQQRKLDFLLTCRRKWKQLCLFQIWNLSWTGVMELIDADTLKDLKETYKSEFGGNKGT